jgi:predicted Zn-dependent protease
MQDYFRTFSEKVFSYLHATEVLLLNYSAESSDFVRLNRNKVRQAGHVLQQDVGLNLISGEKQSSAEIQLSGDLAADVDNAKYHLCQIREQLNYLPDDPYLNYAKDIHNTSHVAENTLPEPEQVIDEIIWQAQGLDLVGIWASGKMVRGFSNSLGQFNWHCHFNFNFDWSVYLHTDKAVKLNAAGVHWDASSLRQKLDHARQTLELLQKPSKTIKPGHYRAYLTPVALEEILSLLGWGGFGLKSHRTAQTPLIQLINDEVRLDERILLTEDHAAGLTPAFTTSGFIKPEQVVLIKDGGYKECLANARSAKEYTTDVNASYESPQSMHLEGGSIPMSDLLQALDTGIYVSNLWYSNYSDRTHCRITGMTRFATLWVENGKAVAPLNVMRFDESIYHLLGDKLVDLSKEREGIFDASTYSGRSDSIAMLPGALVNDFTLTL